MNQSLVHGQQLILVLITQLIWFRYCARLSQNLRSKHILLTIFDNIWLAPIPQNTEQEECIS